MDKLGDDYFAFMTECTDPKACTVLLRGGSKDVLNEIERNLGDAMQVRWEHSLCDAMQVRWEHSLCDAMHIRWEHSLCDAFAGPYARAPN